jgi:glutamate-5-semialdehyde dehydrogenase
MRVARGEQKDAALLHAAELLRRETGPLLEANRADVEEAARRATDRIGRDRLLLDRARIEQMAAGLEAIARLPDPVGRLVASSTRPNGLKVERVRVPLGVVGVIYENRPNVTSDAAGLCLKSGNVAFLRGSSSAARSNAALAGLLAEAALEAGLPRDAVLLVADGSRQSAEEFVKLEGTIDCLIPRGGPGLVAMVREQAKVPYVIDGAGNCHVYVHEAADEKMAEAIVLDAKVSRPGVCNAAESLLIDEAIAASFLPRVAASLANAGVELVGDERSRALWPSMAEATSQDFATEFLSLKMAVAVVDDLEGAIAHIAAYSSGHSEAIVTNDLRASERFVAAVDAAALLVNASTRFIDGGELGLGAEVGISTQKLHARGPMGLEELTCVKYVVHGEGQVRN